MGKVYVLAPLGKSPAVVTELAWYLATVEGHDVRGIELWTTSNAQKGIRKFLVEDRAWEGVRAACGAERLPPLMHGELGLGVNVTAPGHDYAFSTRVFGRGGNDLEDVRTVDEAGVVNANLYDRILELRHGLPDDVALVGGVSGGRKTVSAALQSAFSYQARAQDRLVHVLLHPALEALGRDFTRTFAFPTESVEGVPSDEQVVVYDVPFPRLQPLRQRECMTYLAQLLDKTFEDGWSAMQAAEQEPTALLTMHADGRWTYLILRGEGAKIELRLTPVLGRYLAAAVKGPIDPDALPSSWFRPPSDRASRLTNIRQWRTRVRKRASDLLAVDLAGFIPDDGDLLDVRLRDRVTLERDELGEGHKAKLADAEWLFAG